VTIGSGYVQQCQQFLKVHGFGEVGVEAFLVGALAALLSQENKKVGFVGGMDTPLIHKFEAGYRAGVKHVCPSCEVLAQYAGVTPEAFRNPGRGKELAMSQYQQGVNIIYHASGSTGLGVFEAARTLNKFGIGLGMVTISISPTSARRRRKLPAISIRSQAGRKPSMIAFAIVITCK